MPGVSENDKYRNLYFQACDFQADVDMLPDGIFTEVLDITYSYYILHITNYISHITLYILHITLYILHITLYILHITYYILHIKYYILHTISYYILHTTYTDFKTPF